MIGENVARGRPRHSRRSAGRTIPRHALERHPERDGEISLRKATGCRGCQPRQGPVPRHAVHKFAPAARHAHDNHITGATTIPDTTGADLSVSPQRRAGGLAHRRSPRSHPHRARQTRVAQRRHQRTSALTYALRISASNLNEKQINVQQDSPPGTSLLADATRSQQVFSNIIKTRSNLRRRAVRSGSARNDAGHKIIIDFTHTGVGISPELRPRTFEAFEQGGKGMTNRYSEPTRPRHF